MSNTSDLIEALKCGDEWTAVKAAKELGRLKAREAVPALITALHSEDLLKDWNALDMMTKMALGGVGEGITAINALRCAAADALVQIGDERASTDLLTILQTTDEAEVHFAVVRALTHFTTPEVIATLDTYIEQAIAKSQSDDCSIRSGAVSRLANIQTERAIPALLIALDDTSFVVREEAALALGEIGKRVKDKKVKAEIIGSLANHLSDTYALHSSLPRVCDHVAKALRKIGTKAALEAVKNWHQTQDKQKQGNE